MDRKDGQSSDRSGASRFHHFSFRVTHRFETNAVISAQLTDTLAVLSLNESSAFSIDFYRVLLQMPAGGPVFALAICRAHFRLVSYMNKPFSLYVYAKLRDLVQICVLLVPSS